MSLHLVELPVDLRQLHLWAGTRQAWGRGSDEGLTLHHLLGEVFGPGVLQPFRLMVAPGARQGTLLAYADHDADALRQSAGISQTPSDAAAIRLDRLRSIPRPGTAWRPGQRIGFDLRMRPVVRLASPLSGQTKDGQPLIFRKGAEVDAFLARALRGEEVTREAVYLDWLAARLLPGAELERETSRLASFRRKIAVRDGRRIEGPDVTVLGTLTVTDAAAFARLLASGVGRHRSYGYGMLLLRPPQRPR